MKKDDLTTWDDGLRSEYDFSSGVRGKYADRVAEGGKASYGAELKRVFLSSTYADLISYREAALKAIRQFGWFSVAMEDMVARDDRPRET